jgi:hypothetical protein
MEHLDLGGRSAVQPAPRTLAAQALEAARECLHETRNELGECTAMVGCADGAIPFVCACADCRLADITKPEGNPDRRRDFTTITPATFNKGNGARRCTRCKRDHCWSAITYHDKAYGFPDYDTAARVSLKGGRVSAVHLYPFCQAPVRSTS